MTRSLALLVLCVLSSRGLAGGDKVPKAVEAPKGPAGWKVEVLYEQPKVNYCSVVCCAPDGRVFLAEDPMDMVGPPNRPIDRILCILPDGRITTFAENLYAVFGLVYMDGKLYVHHSPKFSVFEDHGDIGKNRVDLIDCTHPAPWGGMNDHIPANVRLAMDGKFYMSVGDKGIFGAVSRDGKTKAEIIGGGILRFDPDGNNLEVYCTGTRNHLDMAINAEDEMFTYDNTDDGLGWWTKLTHMVDGGFYGYPYDYKPRRPYTLWMMADYGGGSPTGGLAYNEDALPKEYHGNLFMCEWGKGEIARFVVERDGGTFKVKSREAFLKKGSKEFRPVGIAVSADGMSLYIADWNYGGWSNRSVKAGRLIKATYLGKSEAAPKPAWYVPAAMGKKFEATDEELIEGLRHPAQSVRLVAMRRITERRTPELDGKLSLLVSDQKSAPYARWSAIWSLKPPSGNLGDYLTPLLPALKDSDASIRRQAARRLGAMPSFGSSGKAVAEFATSDLIARLENDKDASVRFQAATSLGRIGNPKAIKHLVAKLDEPDLFARYAIFTALSRLGHSSSSNWSEVSQGLLSKSSSIREGTLFAFRGAYDREAVAALLFLYANEKGPAETRGEILTLLGSLAHRPETWKGQWWGTQPAGSLPPLHSAKDWEGTRMALTCVRSGLLHSDPIIRQGAARGVAASHDAEIVSNLVRAVAAEKDEAAAKTMFQSLAQARVRGPESTKLLSHVLVQLWSSELSNELVGESLIVASKIAPTPESTDALLKLSGRKLPAEPAIALLNALAKTNSEPAAAAIAGKVADGEANVRIAAIKLLIPLKSDAATPALLGALKDASANIRKEAVIALGKRKDKTALPALLEVMNDKDVKFDALTALAQMPDVRALAIYIDGMASKNNQQRDACANAVKSLKKEALPIIEARLTKTPPLSADAILQLQKIYAKDAETRKSPLFAVAAKTISIGDFTAAAMKENGDAGRGRTLFMDIKAAACIKCHKVGKDGGEVGPDLSGIGAKYNRLQLAESVLDPSKQILDGYDMTIIETKAGQILQGIVKAEAGDEVTLVDNEGKKIAVKKTDIETREKSKKSIMPDGLHIGMTINEFADLLSYLESLKDKTPPPVKTGMGFQERQRQRLADDSIVTASRQRVTSWVPCFRASLAEW